MRFKSGHKLFEPKSRRASLFVVGKDELGFPVFIHDTYDDKEVPTIFLPIGPEMPELQAKWPGEENLEEERAAVMVLVGACRQYRQLLEGQVEELSSLAEQREELMLALIDEKKKSESLQADVNYWKEAALAAREAAL